MDEQTAFEIGVEGYVYLNPLVLMDVTRRQMTNVERLGDAPLHAPMDTFVHVPAFSPADFRDRLYWPKPKALDGTRTPPALARVG